MPGISKARLVITAVIVEGRSQADVARTYGVSPGWVSKLITRYNARSIFAGLHSLNPNG